MDEGPWAWSFFGVTMKVPLLDLHLLVLAMLCGDLCP